MPEDDAARREPSTREGPGRDSGGALLDADGAEAGGPGRQALPAAAAVSIRWVAVATTLVAAGALLVAHSSGYAATLGVTLGLAVVLAWGWPLLSGSYTPAATSAVLGVSGVAVVLGALRQDLLWMPAAVAFGILLSFFGQILRGSEREGLVLTLLSSFGGLFVVASGTTAVVAANSERGHAVAMVALASVAAAVVGDLLVGVRATARFLGLVVLAVAVLAAAGVAMGFAQVSTPEALGIGAAAGAGSWACRRVFALAPAIPTTRAQVAVGTGSVLAVGVVIHLFSRLA